MRNVRRLSLVGIIILLALVVAPTAFAGVDDYPAPWRAPTAQDSMLDSWGQFNRECTSFCAWRLHSRNGFEIPWAFGYATDWGTHAASLGYAVNMTPAVGAIAWWSAGHVAWVESVNANGTVTIEEYNNPAGSGAYNERPIATGSVSGYIHFKDISASPPQGRIGVLTGDSVQVKDGIGGGWVSEVGGASAFQINGNLIGALCGQTLYIKDGIDGGWVTEQGGVNAFQIDGNLIGALCGQTLCVKSGIGGGWVTEQGGVNAFQIDGNLIGALCGQTLLVKNGVYGGWVTEQGGVNAFQLDGPAPQPVRSPDATPPTTKVFGADSLWHNTSVTLSFSASDNPGGSGMSGGSACTECKVGSGAWTTGTSVTITAPASHANDGLHAVSYRSCDAVGNWEKAKTVTVRIDTTGPTTSARSASGRKAHVIVLRYKVSDALSPTTTAVRLVVRNSHGKVVKSFACATKTIATWYSVKWTPKARGTFRYYVYAKDLAGNAAVVIGRAKVVVR